MIKKQLEHRTIREFTNENVPAEVLEQLISVAQRTATSNGMQGCSIIRVTDQEKKKQISEVCKQEYVTRAPELWVFLVDQYRNERIAIEKDNIESVNGCDMDKFTQGFTDACLTAQNVVNAAESLDLGTVYFGSVLNNPKRMCEILNLPKMTFPAICIGFGYPNQKPQLKPRMNMDFRVFENEYKVFDHYLEELKEYDEEIQTYYDLRDANRRVDSFTNQVLTKAKNPNPVRVNMLQDVRDQGFDLKVN